MSFQSSSVDNEELIHNAVRQGHSISLEIYLKQNPNCINKLFTYYQSKWTPLLAACYYQHEHIVRMLLMRFKPDIEALGTIVLNSIDNHSDIAEGVSPLWTAAAVNNFNIVKLLIELGNANINHLIKTHSTALRAACYHNNIELTRYLIEHGANPYQAKKGNYTNLMLSAGRQFPLIVDYLVNEVKCNINEQDENGQTALYYAVRSRSIKITKFLLEHGALNYRDIKRKVTPLMRAALFGEINLVDIFENYCSDLEWIEAKELLATSFSGCIYHIADLNKTAEYLIETFQLRKAKNLPKQITTESLEIFQYRRECQTLDEFNQLLCSNTKDALVIESILIQQRLLGDDQDDYHDIIYYYGVILAHNHKYNDCLRWWFYALDLKQKYNMNCQPERLHRFISVFARMKFVDHINIPIEDILRLFNLLNYILVSKRYMENFDSYFIILLHLITIVARIIYNDNLEEKQELSINHRRDLYKLIRYIIRYQYRLMENGSSLLHSCINPSTKGILNLIEYPCSLTTHLLISCGADIDAMDIDGNTPLHILMRNNSSSNTINMLNILCDAGAHLDFANTKGHRPMDSMPAFRKKLYEQMKKKIDVTRLKCFCARLIQQQKFSYENSLSISLINFIQKH
ncbi:unnamed protein product [Adineta steineri]|uniref:Uncharacterized protein n=1 Tax=Adineta steineri TaxID=433720 RepID=A0A815RF19_9BILA|nr:unnamed protein product [Adineta steineri]